MTSSLPLAPFFPRNHARNRLSPREWGGHCMTSSLLLTPLSPKIAWFLEPHWELASSYRRVRGGSGVATAWLPSLSLAPLLLGYPTGSGVGVWWLFWHLPLPFLALWRVGWHCCGWPTSQLQQQTHLHSLNWGWWILECPLGEGICQVGGQWGCEGVRVW